MLIIPHYLDSDITDSKLYDRLTGLSSMAKIRTLSVVQPTDKIKTASQNTNSLVNSKSNMRPTVKIFTVDHSRLFTSVLWIRAFGYVSYSFM